MSGIITLLTDFGSQDPFVGLMKGVILTRFPQAQIVDLTHEVDPFEPAVAGFWLARSYRYFPEGTVHVAVVDPGVGTKRDILMAKLDNHVFLVPDNGLLPASIAEAAEVRGLELDAVAALGIEVASATFHGRDIFAPVGAELAAGRTTPEQLGGLKLDLMSPLVPVPKWEAGWVTGAVAAVDRFGNLISNIDRSFVDRVDNPVVRLRGFELPIRRTYGDVSHGEYIALVNSFDVLEVARSGGSAAASLDLTRGDPLVLMPQRR